MVDQTFFEFLGETPFGVALLPHKFSRLHRFGDFLSEQEVQLLQIAGEASPQGDSHKTSGTGQLSEA